MGSAAAPLLQKGRDIMSKEKMIAPIVKLDSGRRVKAGFSNEMYFFYNTRRKTTIT